MVFKMWLSVFGTFLYFWQVAIPVFSPSLTGKKFKESYKVTVKSTLVHWWIFHFSTLICRFMTYTHSFYSKKKKH